MKLKFACYFPAEKPVFLSIDVESPVWVEDLLVSIAAMLKVKGRSVKHGDLRLFKPDDVLLRPKETLRSRALNYLHQQPAHSELEVMELLSSIFPHGPHPADNMQLDIIIADPEVLEMVDNIGDPYDTYKRKVKKALNKRFENLSPGFSPSEIINNPKKLKEVFGEDKCQIHLSQAPAVIFNPALAKLQQRLDRLEQVAVSRPEVQRAADYLRCAVDYYDDETARQNAIKGLFDEAMGEWVEWERSVILDATTIIKPNRCTWYHNFLTGILELKNTLGIDGDAHYQAILDCSKVISQDKYKPYREYCNFPIVLVGVTSNRLEISVAVCLGPMYVTRLLILDLSLGFHTSDNTIRLARVFKALSCCQVDLQNYYDGVISLAPPRLSCLFPNPTPVDPSNTLPKLTYRQFLSRTGQPTSALVDLKNIITAMYIATLDATNQEVIVKFTAHYNEAAHRLLAGAQLAPKLHFCGRVVGDLYMIVMDRVDGKSIWQLQEDKIPIPAIVLTKVEEAVGLLHNEDIVFGDLRGNNILYDASEDRVFLVDFDWAGKDGECRYPVTLNPYNTWADDVLPYGIMRKAHDLWQLDRLKNVYV